MKITLYCKYAVFSVLITACLSNHKETGNDPVIIGDYFGQKPPGDSALLFAPGVISTGLDERDFAISPDGNEIFFCREAGNFKYVTILYSRRIDDVWSPPEVFEFCTNPDYKYVEPHLSPDGQDLYFISNMPANSSSTDKEDIWVCTKKQNKWMKPRNLGAPVNTTSREFFPSVTRDGTIYYTHLDTVSNEEFIYRSKLVNGEYQEPEKLNANVNIGSARYNAFVAVDESYIIIPAYGMPDSYGATDYYISFRDSLDNWSHPVNMGPKINSACSREWSASVSADGKYLFFMSDQMGSVSIGELSPGTLEQFHNSPQNGSSDIYWISSTIIDELRRNAKFENYHLNNKSMDKRTISETIIALETAALGAWHNGNPSPYLDLYSKNFTYFDPAQERRLDGWDKIKDLYESMRGKVKMDKFEILNPVVQQTDEMAVLTFNLHSYAGETLWKENCTEVYMLENGEWKIIHSHWSLTKP